MATMSKEDENNRNAPSVFNSESTGVSYEDWKLDIQLWQEYTSLPKNKHVTAFLLALKEGKVKDVVRSLGRDILISDDGLERIIGQLDRIYKEDVAIMSYRIYRQFVTYVRPHEMSLHDYLSEFGKTCCRSQKD